MSVIYIGDETDRGFEIPLLKLLIQLLSAAMNLAWSAFE